MADTMAQKIQAIIEGSKCESCSDEECLGVSCEGCLTDCLLALIAADRKPLVEALGKAELQLIYLEGELQRALPLTESTLKQVRKAL